MTAAITNSSKVIAALEAAWKAIQKNHSDLPDVMMTVSNGWTGAWGSAAKDRWVEGKPPGLEEAHDHGDAKRMTAITIDGWRIFCGGKYVFQTMLHEAAHVLGYVRDTNTTSRQGRYHNQTFVKLSQELGLMWPEGQEPDSTIGFSEVVYAEGTEKKYAKVIAKLDSELEAYVEIPDEIRKLILAWLKGEKGEGTTTAGPRITRGMLRTATGGASRKSTALPLATCECETPRKFRIAQSTLDQAPITCGACGKAFEIR
jgi:hypothetical protein